MPCQSLSLLLLKAINLPVNINTIIYYLNTLNKAISHFVSSQIVEFNVSSLHREQLRLLLKQGGAATGFSPDDGSGRKEIYRIENFELAPVDEAAHGMFFGGDSYVIKYTYNNRGSERYIIYFWQVRYIKVETLTR